MAAMTIPANLLFEAAADLLAGRPVDAAMEAEARRLLVRLAYLGDDAATTAPKFHAASAIGTEPKQEVA